MADATRLGERLLETGAVDAVLAVAPDPDDRWKPVPVLADITVGYMGGEGSQWLLIRNERGEELAALLGSELSTLPTGSKGKRAGPVKGFLANTERAAGGLPLRRMPPALRRIVGWLMPRIRPRGLEFARARVEMKAVETVLHLRRTKPHRMKSMIPEHIWRLVAPYGLVPHEGERPVTPASTASGDE